MYIEDDYIHYSFQKVDADGRIRIPDNVLTALGILTDDEIQVVATTKCLIIEPISDKMYIKIVR